MRTHSGQYRKAFFSCRKHRIDLNFLVAHDEIAFLEGLGSFVEQVHEVDHLNLFLTSLGYVKILNNLRRFLTQTLGRQGTSPLSSTTIATISDALREKLEKTDLKTYVNTILTAHVVKAPSDHESALSLLLRLKGTHAMGLALSSLNSFYE